MNVPVTSREALVERHDVLSELNGALARVRAGTGELAVITGEAGTGKTSVVREFLRDAPGLPFVLRGACDPLTVPRPLGPVIDALRSVDPAAAGRLASNTRVEAFSLALSLIDGTFSEGRPTIFVVEDVHWADEATLDVLTFLGRRIGALRTMVVLTFRDDEIGPQHPLRVRLGDLASTIRCRIQLHALSASGVAELAADSHIDAADLYRMTGGNPFFVTEILGAGGVALPESVRDAVLARAARLGEGPRAVLDAAAIVPLRIEPWLLNAVAEGIDVRAALEVCFERGLLRSEALSGRDGSDNVMFRHELARVAIVGALSARQRRALHLRALAALAHPPVGTPDPARLAFHATEADDAEAVLEHAPTAAAEASRMGAHEEAARHLEGALRYRYRLERHEQATLLLQLGEELIMLGRSEDAVACLDDAADVAEHVGDSDRQAEAMIRSSAPLVALGRLVEASERTARAAELVAGRAPSRAAALVETSQLSLDMLARRFDPAGVHGQRAIALAKEVFDERVLATALVQGGTSLAMSGDDAGLAMLREGMDIAARIGEDASVALGHTQIGSAYGELRRYDIAVPALEAGIAYASARELIATELYMTAWLGRCQLELGRWDAAGATAAGLVRRPRCVGISRFVALVTLGWLRGRRGDPDVEPLLDEALALARSTGHIQRLWPIAACRAEVAWLGGHLDDELGLLADAARLAAELEYRPAIEELAFWQRLGGDSVAIDADAASTPFGLGAAGRHDLAATRWAAMDCPYEEAVARYFWGDEDELRSAHLTFDRLGAVRMRNRTAAALREVGAAVPRGSLATTRENPFALTVREMEVLHHLTAGRTNRDIAAALYISAKTVDHHVSAVLGKLGVRSRAEAAVIAERLGLFS